MKFVYLFIATIFLGICLQESTCQYYPASGETDTNGDANLDLASSLTTVIVETLSSKIRTLFEVFDVKIRFIRFLRSLYTPENIELVRRSLDLAVRFANWVLQILPSEDGTQGSLLLSLLFNGGSFGGAGETETTLPDKYGPPPAVDAGVSFTSPAPISSSYGPPVVQILRESRSLSADEKKLVAENAGNVMNLHKLIKAGE